MSCGNNTKKTLTQPSGPVTMNLYYTGVDGNARKFVEEMESSGTADAIRAEEGNLRYDYFFSAANFLGIRWATSQDVFCSTG